MNLSAIVIAGGKSSRMGKDKIHLNWQGKTLLNHVLMLVKKFTDDIIISSNTTLFTDFPVIPDLVKNIGPIGGLYTCLQEISNQKTLVLPVDMPLIDEKLIEYLLKSFDKQKDVNIFKVKNQWQTLVGVYDKRLIYLIEKQIKNQDYKLRNLLQKSAYHLIDASSFANKFININTPDEWKKLQERHE